LDPTFIVLEHVPEFQEAGEKGLRPVSSSTKTVSSSVDEREERKRRRRRRRSLVDRSPHPPVS
jgi:hypothetical protein